MNNDKIVTGVRVLYNYHKSVLETHERVISMYGAFTAFVHWCSNFDPESLCELGEVPSDCVDEVSNILSKLREPMTVVMLYKIWPAIWLNARVCSPTPDGMKIELTIVFPGSIAVTNNFIVNKDPQTPNADFTDGAMCVALHQITDQLVQWIVQSTVQPLYNGARDKQEVEQHVFNQALSSTTRGGFQ